MGQTIHFYFLFFFLCGSAIKERPQKLSHSIPTLRYLSLINNFYFYYVVILIVLPPRLVSSRGSILV
jgi:hypothetical protein